MSDNPHETLAKRLLDLWQQQVTHVMNDPQYTRSMLDMMLNMTQSAPYATPFAQQFAPSPAAHGPAVDVLVNRIAELEARLAAMESELARERAASAPTADRADGDAGSGAPRKRARKGSGDKAQTNA